MTKKSDATGIVFIFWIVESLSWRQPECLFDCFIVVRHKMIKLVLFFVVNSRLHGLLFRYTKHCLYRWAVKGSYRQKLHVFKSLYAKAMPVCTHNGNMYSGIKIMTRAILF
ncbi:MAG TPA: hypothetical protein DHV60_00825 [Verrucomicrobiales bacterium]|nr:hypothetical protein [Verrucomicrobiales bacterium]